MLAMLKILNEHPRIVAVLGTASGWFSVEKIAHAKDAAQFAAAAVATLVSICTLIIIAPKAWANIRRWAGLLSRK